MTDALWSLSATEIANGVRTHQFTAVSAVEAALERMAAVNSKINAVTIDNSEMALMAARKADEAVDTEIPIGALHGVPITIKENVDVKGEPTTLGVSAFQNNIAPDNSPVTKNLLDAGAIVIGRTNTPEFGLRWFTENPLRGTTHNPWDLSRNPGGSSGGAAAAVMLGVGAIAHGNDLGGSLRYPAYCCGATTIKPTPGRIPNFNPSAASVKPIMAQLMAVQGPITRNVSDARLALEVMARRDARDPWWTPVPLNGEPIDGSISVAIPKNLGTSVHTSVVEAVKKAASILTNAGYVVEEVQTPATNELLQAWGAALFTDLKHLVEPSIRKYGSDDINTSFDFRTGMWPDIEFADYVISLGKREQIIRDWMFLQESYPIILTPVSLEPPLRPREDCQSSERYREIAIAQTWLIAANFLGLPAAAVPTGLYEGLPTGVQLIGRRFREDLCLDAAQVIEDSVGMLSQQLWTKY